MNADGRGLTDDFLYIRASLRSSVASVLFSNLVSVVICPYSFEVK
jgi:hypothetical protein